MFLKGKKWEYTWALKIIPNVKDKALLTRGLGLFRKYLEKKGRKLSKKTWDEGLCRTIFDCFVLSSRLERPEFFEN